MSLEDDKRNPSKYKFWLACRAYSFQSWVSTRWQVIDKSSSVIICHMIDSISSSLIVILMEIFFHQSHYCATDSRHSLSNLIRLLLSIKVDIFHLDAHPTPTVDQLSPTFATRAHWDHIYMSVKLQQPYYEQLYHHR